MKKISIVMEEYSSKDMESNNGFMDRWNKATNGGVTGNPHELTLLLGVGTDEQVAIYHKLVDKFVELRNDHENVINFHDDFNSGKFGIRSYGNYFNTAEPTEAITVKCHENGNKFRQASYTKYDKYEIYWQQYTNNSGSGVSGYIHNIGMTEDEFTEFATGMAKATMTQNPLFEGNVPEDKFEYVEWNHPKYNESLKTAEERKAKKEADAKIAEAQKESKRKQKVKADVELLKVEKEAETKAE